jgi:hypothetical protein
MVNRQSFYKRGMPPASGGCDLEKPAQSRLGKVCAFSYTTKSWCYTHGKKPRLVKSLLMTFSVRNTSSTR